MPCNYDFQQQYLNYSHSMKRVSSELPKIDIYFQFETVNVVREKAIFTDFSQICQIAIGEIV